MRITSKQQGLERFFAVKKLWTTILIGCGLFLSTFLLQDESMSYP